MSTRRGAGGPDSAWRLPWRGWWAASLGVVLGTALQLQQARLWPATAYLGLAAVALGGVIALRLTGRRWGPSAGGGFSRSGAWGVAVLVLAAALACAQVGLRALWLRDNALPAALEGVDLQVTGQISAMPQRLAWGQRFYLVPESASLAGQSVSLPSPLWLSWSGPAGAAVPSSAPAAVPRGFSAAAAPVPELRAGDRWRFTLRLRRVHGALNPGGFDQELWLWEQGVLATGSVRGGVDGAAPERLAPSAAYPVERWRQAVREAIWQRLLAGPPEAAAARQAGVVVALVTGDQRAIERHDWSVFRATGVAHLMSISGLHITLLAWLARRALGTLWRQTARGSGRLGRACLHWPAPRVASAGGLAVALAYSVFCGWGVPAQRTVGMLLVLTGLQWSGRRWPWSAVWLLMAAVVLLWDPWAWLQPGFWLSFVAVGVLFATDAGLGVGASEAPALASEGQAPRAAFRRLGRSVWGLWREQGVLTLALAPLSLCLFGQLSLVGLLANLLAIPWVTGVVTPLALLGCLCPPLWTVSAWAVQGLLGVLGGLSTWPLATWSVALPPVWAAVAGLVGGLLCVGPWPLRWRCLGWPCLLPVLLWQAERPDPGRFELLAADVGQGNAVIVRTARHTLVYDAGPRYTPDSDAGDRVLLPLLRGAGEVPERLVLSHRDTDHTGGAAALLAAYPALALWTSLEPEHPLLSGRRHTACRAGQAWTWDGVRFEFLHPGPEPPAPTLRPNARSCVLRVQDALGVSALLPGDIEQAQEAALLAQGQPLAADWLLVPHHGSRTSSSLPFVAAVSPRVAVVQAGYRNRFGHPADAVRDRYLARDLQWVETPICGAALWRSQQPDTVVCERERRSRYWHWPLQP
ncbi:DNA internalization-related competence protein ComEC/Rec2 [Curvibacter sp. HBC61]|uniref:DNA internalization-related competence protein ComEC/Rec2 n=1 Tax=Curvibacter cyanobacteriorum TaxID=3026422 RepID=A0ABT5MSI3_9BURK|nr:DNA internalization-related competence protein ComEC/Rec2 [Curvibacter sp. HBC61]MDD0836997.1 DNA internalization-related competence protein ComEC/Rec2 [Curvibacter sp. HBC61]